MSNAKDGTPYDPREGADTPASIYGVYFGVLGLAAATILLSQAGLRGLALPVQMGIASVQAFLVAYFWMHLKRKDKVVTLTALASLFWTALLFVLFLADFVTRWRGGL